MESPEQENICRHWEVPLTVNDNDAGLSKGKVCVSLPAELVLRLLLVLQGVVVFGQGDGPVVLPGLTVPQTDLVLVRGHQEVPVKINGEIAGPRLQAQLRTVQADLVEEAALPVVAVDLPAGDEVSQTDDEVPAGVAADAGAVSVQLLVQLLVVVLLQRLQARDYQAVLGGDARPTFFCHLLQHDLARGHDTGHGGEAQHEDLLDVVLITVDVVINGHFDVSFGLEIIVKIYL